MVKVAVGGNVHLTAFIDGIFAGKDSISFEEFRDLVKGKDGKPGLLPLDSLWTAGLRIESPKKGGGGGGGRGMGGNPNAFGRGGGRGRGGGFQGGGFQQQNAHAGGWGGGQSGGSGGSAGGGRGGGGGGGFGGRNSNAQWGGGQQAGGGGRGGGGGGGRGNRGGNPFGNSSAQVTHLLLAIS